MKPHAFGCGGDAACNCGCPGSSGSSGDDQGAGLLGATGMDPVSMLIDTGAAFLPVPGPIRDAAATAARQMFDPNALPPGAQAALDAAQRNLDAQAQQAAQAAAAAAAATVAAKRPRVLPPRKRGMKRGTKVALAVTGGILVAAGIAVKVAL